MSYPEPLYRGDTGLINATLEPADRTPELTYPSGGTVHFLATGASTGGQFGLYRWEMAAAQGGPQPHFHRSISESFYILSGTIRLFDGARWIDARPGDLLFVPEGGIHAFRNDSGAPASMLILFAPGAPREDYFETTARMAAGLQLSDDEKTAFYLRHDTFWT
jgi:mannose-6-phosphate isomerase-like protein (cupin superfamily)